MKIKNQIYGPRLRVCVCVRVICYSSVSWRKYNCKFCYANQDYLLYTEVYRRIIFVIYRILIYRLGTF